MPSIALAASTVTFALLASASTSDLTSEPRLSARFDAHNASDYWSGDSPPMVDNSTFDLYAWSRGLDGVDQRGNFFWMHVLLLTFITLCTAIFALRMTRLFQAHLRLTSSAGSMANQNFWRRNQSDWWPWIKYHVEYAPLWKKRHNQEIQLSSAVSVGTLPSRLHMLLLISFLSCNIAYCLVLPWHVTPSHSVVAALRGRAGMLATWDLVPGVLFALRNNPLLWVTGVSYDTFNLLHRSIMKVVGLLALVHALCWATNTYAAGKWTAISWSLNTVPSYQWGLVAMVIFLVMIILAWSPIRHAWYETFVNTHRLFAFLSFLALYLHLKDHDLPQVPWIAAVAVFWGYEYACRIYSLIYYNVSRDGITTVTVEALPSEACRVTFHLKRTWRPRSGCHAHMYLPSVGLWSSHPFSIAWADLKAPETTDMEKNNIALFGEADAQAESVSMVVRARSGFTRQLFDKASAQSGKTFTAMGFIEGLGSYGGHHSLRSYGTVILFAGGIGITHQVMYIRDLVTGFHAGTIATRKIVLCWSIPNAESLTWIQPWMDQILKLPGRKECLKIKIFITKPRQHGEMISGSGTVQMYPGRCNPGVVLADEVKEQVGTMAVTVCGAGGFSDSVRAAVRPLVRGTAIDFIEEAFTY